MKLHRIVNSFIDENTYIIYENNSCIIVDPGSDVEKVFSFIEENKIDKVYIYLTHAHVDHIIGVKDIQDKYNAPVYLYEDELDLLKNPRSNLAKRMNLQIEINNVTTFKDKLEIPGFEIKFHHVPGHTSGHTMLEVNKLKAIFTGDFIFYHEIGRCDLPTSSISDMYNSLDYLITLNPELILYPGHGQSTTIKEEKKNNRYINR